jgi:hypothetical protein
LKRVVEFEYTLKLILLLLEELLGKGEDVVES